MTGMNDSDILPITSAECPKCVVCPYVSLLVRVIFAMIKAGICQPFCEGPDIGCCVKSGGIPGT